MQIVALTVDELEQIIERSVNKALSVVSTKQPPEPTVVKEKATRAQAAAFFNVSLVTLDEWIKSGRVKGQRIGRRVLFNWSDLNAALTTIKTEVAA